MRPHKESYLEILFKDFVKVFNLLDNNYIKWLSLAFSLINGLGFSVDNQDKFYIIILKFRLQ